MTGTFTLKSVCLGAAMAVGLLGLAAPAHAVMTADEFMASMDDMRRVCRRLDDTMWIKKRTFGCDEYVCGKASKMCHRKQVKRPNYPPLTHVAKEKMSDNGGGQSGGGKSDGGGDGPNY